MQNVTNITEPAQGPPVSRQSHDYPKYHSFKSDYVLFIPMGYTDMHMQNTFSDPCVALKVLQSRFISCHVIPVKSILGSVDCICPLSVTLGLRSSDGSWRVP